MWIRIAAVLVLCSGFNVASAQIGPPTTGSDFHRFDAQPPWLHGFRTQHSPFQGHAAFRPSNYKQAIARSGYADSTQFFSAYTYRRPAAPVNRMNSMARSAPRPTVQPAQQVRPMVAEPHIENGAMSLIRSIRVAQPARLPVSKKRESQVLNAIQTEHTGPLFPLPF